MFRCEGCVFYRPEGWAIFAAHGRPIREGPCRQYHFYSREAARSACGGRLKKEAMVAGAGMAGDSIARRGGGEEVEGYER